MQVLPQGGARRAVGEFAKCFVWHKSYSRQVN